MMIMYVRFEVFTAVTMKNGVFWNVTLVALVRTDVSKELSASFIRATRTGELVTTLAVTSSASAERCEEGPSQTHMQGPNTIPETT
jgi:hypothetical protein